MSKGRVIALLVVAVLVVILLFTKGSVDVNLLFTTITPRASLAFLSFTTTGVIVGILLK